MHNANVVDLPSMLALEHPEDVVKAYPEMAWEMIKDLNYENEKLKYIIEVLKETARLSEKE